MHASRSDDYTAPNTVSATDDTVFLAIRGDASNNFVYVKNGMLNICPDNLSISILDREVTRCAEDAVSAFIPQYVHTIGPSAFIRCESLTSVSSVNDMLDICESAFYGCGQLSGINLPSSFYLSAAPSYAFYGCSALQNVRILSVASYVGEHAFAGCKTL